MEKPPITVGRIDKSALVRAVHLCQSLLKNDAFLVGPVDVLRPEHCLPSLSDAAFGDDQIVVAVAFHEFRALGHGSCVDRYALVEQLFAVGRHAMHDDGACAVAAATQICLSVVVPEGAGVFPFRDFLQAVKGCPRPVWVVGRAHEESFFVCAEEDVEPSVVPSDARCPCAPAVVAVFVPARIVETVVHLTDDSPVDEVVRFEHLHAEEVEVGRHHVVFLPDADHVRVAVVGVEHRVDERAVALVSPLQLCLCSEDGHQSGHQECFSHGSEVFWCDCFVQSKVE